MKKILALEDVEKLLRAWRESNDKEALNLLVAGNGGLVGFFAKKHLGKGLSFEELISAGNVGLLNAINIYDYEGRGMQTFRSYISVSIENGMLMEIRRYKKHSHVMSLNEPIGTSKDGDELTLEDILSTDPDVLIDNVIEGMKNDIVKDALKSLTTREQKIILLRYGLDDDHRKTQEEVAEILGCTKATVSNQERKALIKMRHPRNTRKLKNLIEE